MLNPIIGTGILPEPLFDFLMNLNRDRNQYLFFLRTKLESELKQIMKMPSLV